MTLDDFIPPSVVKPKQQDPDLYVVQKCSDCDAELGPSNPEYDLKIKGQVKPYCRGCARKRMPKPPKTDEGGEESE